MFERKFQHLKPTAPVTPPPAAEASELLSSYGDTKLDPQQELKREQESEAKITFRLKSAAGAGLVMLIIYALISAPSKGNRRGEERVSMREMSEQEEFEQLRASHNVEAAKKQGFFQKIFCGSHQRSKFCYGEE